MYIRLNKIFSINRSDIIDCGTGTMEPLIEEFRIQGTITLCKEPRLRLRIGELRTTLLVARMCTLRALIDDWSAVYKKVRLIKFELQMSYI